MTVQIGWGFEVVFAGSVCKREGERNEDQYLVDRAQLRFALSDGASVSYDPATWAELLCKKYVDDPDISTSWIEDAVRSYNGAVDRDALPWMKQAAFDQGSFASLIGLSINIDDKTINLTAFGDSNVLIMKEGIVTERFPISDVEEFSRSPNLLCTVGRENTYITEDLISTGKRTFDLKTVVDEDKIAILMATDALSAWVMRTDTEARLNSLFAITEQEKFAELVRDERQKGDLKIDDTTMITIRITRDISPEH